MKATILFVLFTIASSAFASSYEETMKANIEKLYSLTSASELQTLANHFERVGNAEPDEWLPEYYAAYCFARSTFFDNMNAKEKHQQLDKAQKIIDELLRNRTNESEIYALQALVFQLRITDMSKGASYSGKASEAIAVAEKLNAENPRVHYLRGSNTFHTPKFFGGGADKARPHLEKAAQLFESTQAQNELMPTWGAFHNQQLLNQCKQSD